MTAMTHKEMTAHIRKRIKIAKIPARVKMNEWCGRRVITVVTPTYEFRWGADQLKTIGAIAKTNNLTGAQNSPIDIDNTARLTGATQLNFEFHG